MNTQTNETLNIQDLPDEMIEKILSYVPDRFNAAATCSKFYDAVRRIENMKHSLIIRKISSRKWKTQPLNIDCNTSFQALMNTNRRFDEMVIETNTWPSLSTHQTKQMLRIAERFGNGIRKLKWSLSENSYGFIIKLLNMLPNLEELVIKESLDGGIYEDVANELLNLPHLKDLVIKCDLSIYSPRILKSLLPKTIRSFSVEVFSTTNDFNANEIITGFLNCQHNITILNICGEIVPAALQNLQLTHLHLFDEQNLSIVDILRTQTQLHSFKYPFAISLEQIEWICRSMNELIELDICPNREALYAINNISRLRKLKSLRLNTEEEINLTLPHCPTVEVLEFPRLDFVNIAATAENFPRVTKLKTYATSAHCLNSILDNFKQLRVLCLEVSLGVQPLQTIIAPGANKSYPHLIELDLKPYVNLQRRYRSENWESFIVIMSILPNLEILSISGEILEYNIVAFDDVMKHLRDIKELQISMTLPRHFSIKLSFPAIITQMKRLLKHLRIIVECRQVNYADQLKVLFADEFKVSSQWRTCVTLQNGISSRQNHWLQ